MDWRRASWATLGWIVGVGLVIVSFHGFRQGLWHGAPFILLAGLVSIPMLRSYAERKTGIRVPGALAAILCVGLLSYGANLAGDQQNRQRELAEQAAQAASQKRIAERRAAVEREFRDNKTAILVEAQRLYELGEHATAAKHISPFAAISDPDLARIRDKNRAMVLRQELAGTPPQLRVAQIYSEIARLDPADGEARSKAAELEALVAAEKRRVDAERVQAATRQRREELIKSQFSPWDGSHRAVERSIKENMKNPGSYEHIETRYIDKGGETFIVVTRFRGTNSFNAVVPNVATATVSSTGEVTSIQIQ